MLLRNSEVVKRWEDFREHKIVVSLSIGHKFPALTLPNKMIKKCKSVYSFINIYLHKSSDKKLT